MSPMNRNRGNELTIVIPAKNEAKLIPRLLTSLTNQDYPKMSSVRVLVADANSTDGTAEIVMGFRDRLNVGVIGGGMPAVGRNHGAAQADTPYLLFLDADIELADRSLVRRCVEKAREQGLHCVTTSIVCKEGSWVDKLSYEINDCFQYLSYLHRPFATGMFMLFDRKKFWELGGFHEQILFAEDYRLSQQVERKRFAVVRGGVYTTNRRFKRMGHVRVGWLFLKTAMNYWNEKHFLRDHKYWAEPAVRRGRMLRGQDVPVCSKKSACRGARLEHLKSRLPNDY
jgi:glycosyltransferase involved in cell wall biosynthesis